MLELALPLYLFTQKFYPNRYFASIGDEDLGMVHDGAICPHSGMDRMILPRVPLVKMLLILVRLGGSHAEAACSPVKGTRDCNIGRSSKDQLQDKINETASGAVFRYRIEAA